MAENETSAADGLRDFAKAFSAPGLTVIDAVVSRDERQDGEDVTRVLLLLREPEAETWDVNTVRDLRQTLGRRATELGLPSVSLVLVPESEAEFVEPFAS